MKVFLNKINESWIVDRVRNEWIELNGDLATPSVKNADIIWILSPWLWQKVSKKRLEQKKVLCSQYHFDFENYDFDDFYKLDKYVDEYHVISKKTEEQLRTLTEKKIP